MTLHKREDWKKHTFQHRYRGELKGKYEAGEEPIELASSRHYTLGRRSRGTAGGREAARGRGSGCNRAVSGRQIRQRRA